MEKQNVKIDQERFHSNLKRLKAAWTWPQDVLVIVMGKLADEAVEYKAAAMHHWLFCVEFPESVVALCRDGKVFIFASAKKMEYLRQVEGDDVKLVVRAAGQDVDVKQVEDFAKQLCGGKEKITVGMLQKEKHVGAFAETFTQTFVSQSCLDIVECREDVSTLLAQKDDGEVAFTKRASLFAHLMMSTLFIRKVEDIIDSDLKQSHREVCAELEEELENEEQMEMWKQKHGLDPGEMDIVYASIQSGNQFELKPAVVPSEHHLPMKGSYVLSLGVKYAEYSACVTRTLLVEPNVTHKAAYSFALEVQAAAIARLKPDVPFRDVFLAAKNMVEQKRPDLLENFVKNVGFVLGLEFKDPQMALVEKSDRKVLPGMTFCISVGFSDPGAASPWAVWLCDTVLLDPKTGAIEITTEACDKKQESVMYEIGSENEETQPQPQQQQQQQQQFMKEEFLGIFG